MRIRTLADLRDLVGAQFAEHFTDAKFPPLVFVEWDSALSIEIELIASVPPGGKQLSEAAGSLVGVLSGRGNLQP